MVAGGRVCGSCLWVSIEACTVTRPCANLTCNRTFLFNEVVKPPKWRRWWRKDGELLPERPIEHH